MKWFPPKLARFVTRKARWQSSPAKPNPTFTKSVSHAAGVRVMAPGGAGQRPSVTKLEQVTNFGPNPGNLRMYEFVPDSTGAGAPLIVILHGCNQSAEDYASGAGWKRFAAENGAALLLPQQRLRNNPTMCFNWFQRADAMRDSGEAQSIRQMIAHMHDAYDIDETRVFVTGLSAGGAMTTAMLAAYPEVFSGGAVIAGLPFGAATNMGEAFAAMTIPVERAAEDWGNMVRDASSHDGPWPRLSIWHGNKDRTVASSNADALERQWRHLHDLEEHALTQVEADDLTHRTWHNGARNPVLETRIIDGMDHGVPIDALGRTGDAWGSAGPFMLDVGLSSTRQIADFWGLIIPDKSQRRWRR